jgi:hypothetical protein
MSKLVDKLDNLNKAAAPTMGFRTAGATGMAMSMLVAAELTGKSEDDVKELAGLNLAAGIIDSAGLSAAALSKYAKVAGSTIIGLNLSVGKAVSGWKLITGDIDFVIFDIHTPVSVFEGKDIDSLGKMLRLGIETDSGLLRSVHNLYPDIDAVLVDLRLPELTVEVLMQCRRIADFAGRHVLAIVGGSPSESELLALRESGVKVLVMSADCSLDEISSAADRVAALPRPDRKKEKKDIVLLPKFGLAPAAREEDGDGDDEE